MAVQNVEVMGGIFHGVVGGIFHGVVGCKPGVYLSGVVSNTLYVSPRLG